MFLSLIMYLYAHRTIDNGHDQWDIWVNWGMKYDGDNQQAQ